MNGNDGMIALAFCRNKVRWPESYCDAACFEFSRAYVRLSPSHFDSLWNRYDQRIRRAYASVIEFIPHMYFGTWFFMLRIGLEG
jgi:hypothetical protein